MRNSRPLRFAIYASCGVLCLRSWGARGQQADPKQPASDRLRSALARDAALEGDASAPYDRQIEFLGTLYGTNQEEAFYLSALDKIAEAHSAASLPALESLLNRDVWRPGVTEHYLQRFRHRASEVWLDIRWQGATEKQKCETALYGLRPDSPVRLDPEVSIDRLIQLGAVARGPLYASLVRPTLKFVENPWGVNQIAKTSELLSNKAFEPANKEIDDILAASGTWGQAVLIGYLVERRDERGIPAIVQWVGVHAAEPQLIAQALGWSDAYSASPVASKGPLIRALTAVGNQAESRLALGAFDFKGLPNPYLIGMVNEKLLRLGASEESIAYFKHYLQFRKSITTENLAKQNVGDDDLQRILQGLTFADGWAQRAAKEWNIRPE